MFAKIKDWEIEFMSDKDFWWMIKISDEDYDKLLKWFMYKNWEFIEREISKEEKLQNLKQELETITNDLVNLNWKIEWAKKLKEMWAFDEDDEIELLWYEKEAQELIIKRTDLKVQIKSL